MSESVKHKAFDKLMKDNGTVLLVVCRTISLYMYSNKAMLNPEQLNLLSCHIFFPAVHFFIIYSQIGVTTTLLIVSDIHNHSTNCRLVLPDLATVLYHTA